jgi:hypothetical protein
MLRNKGELYQQKTSNNMIKPLVIRLGFSFFIKMAYMPRVLGYENNLGFMNRKEFEM